MRAEKITAVAFISGRITKLVESKDTHCTHGIILCQEVFLEYVYRQKETRQLEGIFETIVLYTAEYDTE